MAFFNVGSADVFDSTTLLPKNFVNFIEFINKSERVFPENIQIESISIDHIIEKENRPNHVILLKKDNFFIDDYPHYIVRYKAENGESLIRIYSIDGYAAGFNKDLFEIEEHKLLTEGTNNFTRVKKAINALNQYIIKEKKYDVFEKPQYSTRNIQSILLKDDVVEIYMTSLYDSTNDFSDYRYKYMLDPDYKYDNTSSYLFILKFIYNDTTKEIERIPFDLDTFHKNRTFPFAKDILEKTGEYRKYSKYPTTHDRKNAPVFGTRKIYFGNFIMFLNDKNNLFPDNVQIQSIAIERISKCTKDSFEDILFYKDTDSFIEDLPYFVIRLKTKDGKSVSLIFNFNGTLAGESIDIYENLHWRESLLDEGSNNFQKIKKAINALDEYIRKEKNNNLFIHPKYDIRNISSIVMKSTGVDMIITSLYDRGCPFYLASTYEYRFDSSVNYISLNTSPFIVKFRYDDESHEIRKVDFDINKFHKSRATFPSEDDITIIFYD